MSFVNIFKESNKEKLELKPKSYNEWLDFFVENGFYQNITIGNFDSEIEAESFLNQVKIPKYTKLKIQKVTGMNIAPYFRLFAYFEAPTKYHAKDERMDQINKSAEKRAKKIYQVFEKLV